MVHTWCYAISYTFTKSVNLDTFTWNNPGVQRWSCNRNWMMSEGAHYRRLLTCVGLGSLECLGPQTSSKNERKFSQPVGRCLKCCTPKYAKRITNIPQLKASSKFMGNGKMFQRTHKHTLHSLRAGLQGESCGSVGIMRIRCCLKKSFWDWRHMRDLWQKNLCGYTKGDALG